MIRSESVSPRGRIAASLASLALVLVLVLAAAGPAAAEAGVHYVKEDLPAYEQQLSGGQIAAATINKRVGTVRLTLKNGEHFLVHYKSHEEPTVYAALTGKGVVVTVLKPSEAQKESKAPVKHKLRYIAGGILIVVVVIVGAVLLVDRKRKREAE